MRRAGVRRALLVLLVAGLALAPAARGADLEPAPTLSAADEAVVARVLAERGLGLDMPRPGWGAWVVHLGKQAAAWLAGLLEGFLDRLVEGMLRVGAAGGLWAVLGALLIGAAVATAVVVGVRWLRRRRRPPAAPAEEVLVAAAAPAAGLGPDAWRRELDRRLAQGRLDAALEAGWWWLAATLAGAEPDPAWTGRELLARAAAEPRRRLAPLLGDLEVLAYGPRPPSAGAIHHWVRRLEGELA